MIITKDIKEILDRFPEDITGIILRYMTPNPFCDIFKETVIYDGYGENDWSIVYKLICNSYKVDDFKRTNHIVMTPRERNILICKKCGDPISFITSSYDNEGIYIDDNHPIAIQHNNCEDDIKCICCGYGTTCLCKYSDDAPTILKQNILNIIKNKNRTDNYYDDSHYISKKKYYPGINFNNDIKLLPKYMFDLEIDDDDRREDYYNERYHWVNRECLIEYYTLNKMYRLNHFQIDNPIGPIGCNNIVKILNLKEKSYINTYYEDEFKDIKGPPIKELLKVKKFKHYN